MMIEEVFDDWKKINVYDVIEVIKYGGGLIVLVCLGKFDNYDLIFEFVLFGIDGLEKYYLVYCLRDFKVFLEFI